MYVFELKLRFSPPSFLVIRSNFREFSSKAIGYIDPIIFCYENTNSLRIKVPVFFFMLLLDNYIYITNEIKTPEKDIFYTNMKNFQK